MEAVGAGVESLIAVERARKEEDDVWGWDGKKECRLKKLKRGREGEEGEVHAAQLVWSVR